jgi:hypothetical protein
LLTSLLDPLAYPADEIVALYHERWELELGFDEIKTHTLEREEMLLRSKAPERISYCHALNFIRVFWFAAWLASPGVIPRRLKALHEELALLILSKRRKRPPLHSNRLSKR